MIDGAPRVNEFGRAAIVAIGLVTIPMQPLSYDVCAMQDIVALMTEARV